MMVAVVVQSLPLFVTDALLLQEVISGGVAGGEGGVWGVKG